MRSILQPSLRSVFIGLCGLVIGRAEAGNIQITGPTLTGNTGTSALVQFNLSWESSWRGGGVNNWDAAWVFVKYRTIGGSWQHVLLNNTGHTAPAGSMIDLGLLTPGGTPWNAVTNPVVGVFVRRGADGNGTFNLTGVQLLWDYGAAGLAYNDITQVQVFAIEMVAVLQGAFAAGSGGTESSAFTLTTITTSNSSAVPGGSGSLGGQAGGYPTGQVAPNILWPNGFNAFYCMKYEVSQQGYVDFLNTLTYAQQVTRTANAPTSAAGTPAMHSTNQSRNGIDVQVPGVASTTPATYACNLDGDAVFGEATDGKDIACGWMNWGDLAAYMDWSGLRPMTELEFEKACRGPLPPVANEYPWGTTGIATNPYTLANAGASTEGIATNYSTTLGNANYGNTDGSIDGPMRVGLFAANGSNSGRITAGATYYGIMEMAGNQMELCVTIGAVAGRAFTGLHGNGTLSGTGDPDPAAWPSASTADGMGRRCGSWGYAAQDLRLSERFLASSLGGARSFEHGGRGVRSVP